MTKILGPSAPRRYVAWITLMTVALAFVSSDPVTDDYVRPLFFVALLSFFVVLGRSQPGLRSLPYRLIEMGFLLLSIGSLAATFLRGDYIPLLDPGLRDNMAFGLDRGVGFLLGFSLLSYGIVLWVPEILESRRVLHEKALAKGEALRQAQDVIVRQEALVSVGELSAGVAHELRNPLAVLKSALQRIRAADLDAGERLRCLEVMERAVDKANLRITGLLDLGRATDFRPRPCPAHEVIKKAVDLALPQARLGGVELEAWLPAEDVRYFGDPDLVLQVLLNLTRNAIQAVPHAGPVRVRCEPKGGGLAFVVEDRGCGLDPAHQEKLFTPFFTTKDDGTGLGLTVSANLVEKHGGRLWLEPRPDGGVRSWVELPAGEGVRHLRTEVCRG